MILTFILTLLSALYDKGKRFTNHIPRFIFRSIVVVNNKTTEGKPFKPKKHKFAACV